MRASLAPALAATIALGLMSVGCATHPGHPTSRQVSVDYDLADASRDDIRMLWGEIRQWRHEDGLPMDPDELLIRQTSGMSVQTIRLARSEPESKSCQDKCSIKEAICDNAESICRIADDLGGDPWAAGKCRSAKASCKEATERCSKCVEEEGGDGSADGSADAGAKGDEKESESEEAEGED